MAKYHRLVAITYPSGAVVTYLRDATGRITGVTAQPTAGSAAVTVVSDVDYLPFGPATSMTFGNGRLLARTYDANYGIDAITDPDRAAAKRAFEAMMEMGKIDIAAIEAARRG